MIRREDERLLKGEGRYTADINLSGQLHAHVLRADRAHADIVSLDAEAARAMPGVHLVLTGEHLFAEGWKSLPGGVPYEGIGGKKQLKPHWPALAQGKVHYVGEPVALIVADTPRIAQDAAEAIAVEYRDLPAVVGFEAAIAPGAPQIHKGIPGNLAFEFETGDRAAVEAAFDRAKFRSRLAMDSQRLAGAPIELRAFIAEWQADRGFTVYTPTQGANGMRAQIEAVTGIAPDRLRVITHDIGGSFGLRSFAYAEHIATMLAAKTLGRPVKWVATRAELFLSENQGRALTLTGELALDAEGRFLALRWDDTTDLGAYSTPFGPQIGTKNVTVTMGGVYRIPAMYAHCRVAYSNAAPVSAYRGAGRPDIAYAIERLVDHAAAEHGFDPVELRRRNFVQPAHMPYKTANGTTYDCGEFERVMDKALALAGAAGFAARRAASQKAGRLRGLGIATFLEISAAGVAPKDQAFAHFDAAGHLHVYLVAQSTGQGHETAFASIVAEGLGVPPERIQIHEGDPDVKVVGNGTGGSRSLYGAGSACKLLAQKIVEAAAPQAAIALGLDPAPGAVSYAAGVFSGSGKSIGLFELAAKLAPGGGADAVHPLDCMAEGAFGATFPNGCHVAEVEIDPDTGETDIVGYVTVDDIGNAIDHAGVEGQVHGGVMQGVGQVLGEHIVYDENGQLLSASFLDYPMPRADWMRGIRCDEHPVPTKANALGAKGVGESGTSGSIPAVMNAVMDALRPLGIGHVDMPLTPDRLWRVVSQARRKAA